MEPIGQVPSSITALMKEFRTITNNMANTGTTGFKRTVNSFSRQLMDRQESAGLMGRLDENRGIVANKSELDFGQGILTSTGRNFDIALSGDGWFVVETQQGRFYTRSGAFMTNSTGQLVDAEGNMIAGADGPIVIPSSVAVEDVVISGNGTVSTGDTKLGQLKVVEFGDKNSELILVGAGLFKAPEGIEPKPLESAQVRQGYLESSNVNATEELVDLIKVMRLYEANMKLLNKASDTSKTILDLAANA